MLTFVERSNAPRIMPNGVEPRENRNCDVRVKLDVIDGQHSTCQRVESPLHGSESQMTILELRLVFQIGNCVSPGLEEKRNETNETQ